MRFPARLLGVLLAFLLVFFVSKVSFAQVPSYIPQNTQAQNLSLGVPNNLNTYAQSVLFSVMSAVGCQLAGIDPANPNQPCLGVDTNTGKIGFTQNKGGLIGFMSGMIIALYNPPIHTSDYVNYLFGNFGIAKSANAQNYQGVGLTTIAPIAGLWIIFRNIVYLLFVVIFVLIGVGIMLRLRIDPRTVMTIQNQIPKIVIGIILVTLSFPIAGFLIDIMWVVILIVISILSPVIGNPSANFVTPFGLTGIILPGGAWGGILAIAEKTAGFIGTSIFNAGFTTNNVTSLVNPTLPTAGCSDIIACLGNVIGTAISAILGAVVGFILGVVVGLIAFFVVTIALIWALFKLWFELLKAYVSILIGIIFAPFWIVAGLLPNPGGEKQALGFGNWLRDMLGNLMAFPVAIGMFFLAAIFAAQFNNNSTVFFLPPLIGPQGNDFGAIIAFGILMMTPNVVKMTKAAFKSTGLGIGPAGGALGIAAAGALGGSIKNRLYYTWRNPTTGQMESGGPLAAAQRNATARITGSGVGRGVGRITQPIRNNRFVNFFRPRPPAGPTPKTPEQLAEETTAQKLAQKRQADRE